MTDVNPYADERADTDTPLDMTRVHSKSVSAHQGSIIAVLFDNAAKKLPKYAHHFNMVKPYAVKAGDFIDAIYPKLRRLADSGEGYYAQVRPFVPDEALPLVFGFVVCFFGGSYITLIAATECVRLVIWERMYKAFAVILNNYNAAYEASRKDDLVDDDGDGIADVKQITGEELITRKFYLFLRTVNPEQMSEALTVMWACTLSVVATLRVQFAQAVTLGCSLGEILHTHLRSKTDSFLHRAIPAELSAWAPIIADYGFRLVGCIIAWWLSRIIATFHAAIRGADMFVKHAVVLMKKKGYLQQDLDVDGPQVSLFIGLIAFLGFYWQFSNGFGLPFPLNVLLFPFTIAEWTLSTTVMLFGGVAPIGTA